MTSSHKRIMQVLRHAKRLAKEYRALTGKPLGIAGEVAEFEAARLLGLELSPARQAGFDATEGTGRSFRRLEIKGRCLLPGCKPSQRVGSIKIAKNFDAVLLVLMDEYFDALAIHDADRRAVITALAKPGSKARNKRGTMSVAQFKAISTRRWVRPLRKPPRRKTRVSSRGSAAVHSDGKSVRRLGQTSSQC
jgi:hypothetical protein